MHPNARGLVRKHLTRADWQEASVLDVGSYNVNGTLRGVVEKRGWTYTGLDIVPGDNVDIVAEHPYEYPFPDGFFDAVVSCSTMEHVAAIWLWVPELVRILRPGGLLVIVAPNRWKIDHSPPDYWRILPSGMEYLFTLDGRLENIQAEAVSTDTAGSAFKKAAV